MATVLPNSGDMLPMVARSARGRLDRPSPKNSTNLPTTPFLRRIFGDGQDQVGGRGALAQLAREPEANDLGDQHGDGLAEHGGLGLDAAHAPAEDAKAVDHGRVRVGAHDGVGVGHCAAPSGPRTEDHAGQVLQVHLVHDARVRWHHLEVPEGILPPAQEAVALLVAREFDARCWPSSEPAVP